MSEYDTSAQEGTAAELTDFDARPGDCNCAPCMGDLPCWACYRDGFRAPNPNADGVDD